MSAWRGTVSSLETKRPREGSNLENAVDEASVHSLMRPMRPKQTKGGT